MMEPVDPTGILEGPVKPERSTPDHDEQEIVGLIKDRFHDAEKARSWWERTSDFYRMFLRGNQFLLRSRSTNEVVRATVVADSARGAPAADNILRPTHRAVVGKLSRIVPTCVVVPATDDQQDYRAASVAEALLAFHFRKQRLRPKYIRAAGQLSGWAGTAIFEAAWDKLGGEDIAWCTTCHYVGGIDMVGSECPSCVLENEKVAALDNEKRMGAYDTMKAQAESLGMESDIEPPPIKEPEEAPILVETNNGDVCVDLLDPRDFYPEPHCFDMAAMRWAIKRKALPISELCRMFPEHADFIAPESGIRESHFGNTTQSGGRQELDEHAYLYQYHEKPSTMYKRGRLISMVNDRIVQTQDSPYHKLRRLPFFVFRFDSDDGEFWGESWIANAWSIVRDRNKLLGLMASERDFSVTPKWLIPFAAQINPSELENSGGRSISYNHMGGKPSRVELGTFPPYVYGELDRMQRSVQEKATVTDQEMGRSGGDTSGRFAALLEAQSSESIAPIVMLNNDEWTELHRAILILCQCYYDDERTWTVRGRENVQTYAWKDANLSPGWDIELAEEDSLSRNPALRLQQAERLLAAGVFTDPSTGQPDMRQFKRVAGLKLPGVGIDLEAAERTYASQIPEAMIRGEFRGPMPWDDAKICADELAGWLRSAGRSAPPQISDAVYQIWLVYMQALAGTPIQMPQTETPAQSAEPQSEATTGEGPTGITRSVPPLQEAGQITAEADRTAEAAAAPLDHES